MSTAASAVATFPLTCDCGTVAAARQVVACAKYIKTYRLPQSLADLLTHERNDSVRFVHKGQSSSHHKFENADTGATYRGLTKDLEAAFWDPASCPPGAPDSDRSLQLARAAEAADRMREQADRERRRRIRAIEAEDERFRNSVSGIPAGIPYLRRSARPEFSGEDDFGGDFANMSGGRGGDLSGCSANASGGDPDSDGRLCLPQSRVDGGASFFGEGGARRRSFFACLDLLDSTKKCAFKGRGPRHGARVHEDVEQIVKLVLREADLHSGDPESTAKETERVIRIASSIKFLDPCALALLDALVSKRIVPIRAEFPVYDEHLSLATKVDLVAWDVEGGDGVLVELKTGHNAQVDYGAHDGYSYFTTHHPGYCVQDSALNRARLQLLVPLAIIARNYGVQIERALVVRSACRSEDAGGSWGSGQRGGARRAERKPSYVQFYTLPDSMCTPGFQEMIDANLAKRASELVRRSRKATAQIREDKVKAIEESRALGETWGQSARDPATADACQERWLARVAARRPVAPAPRLSEKKIVIPRSRHRRSPPEPRDEPDLGLPRASYADPRLENPFARPAETWKRKRPEDAPPRAPPTKRRLLIPSTGNARILQLD